MLRKPKCKAMADVKTEKVEHARQIRSAVEFNSFHLVVRTWTRTDSPGGFPDHVDSVHYICVMILPSFSATKSHPSTR